MLESGEPFSNGSCTIKLSLSALGAGGRSGETATVAALAGGGGERASGGEGAFWGPWPSMPNNANRNARATSDTLSERLVPWLATRSRPEWKDGDLGIPSGETARRGLVSAAANIAREGARAAGPAWTIAGGGRQRHPSGSRRRRDRSELRGRPDWRAAARTRAAPPARAPRPSSPYIRSYATSATAASDPSHDTPLCSRILIVIWYVYICALFYEHLIVEN